MKLSSLRLFSHFITNNRLQTQSYHLSTIPFPQYYPIDIIQYFIKMSSIINYNPQDNPHLTQIYQILLLAGYFRIRISSLKAFDKVQYNDEMQIGQKIRVAEVVCQSLMKMKCPFRLQPFQVQGLDVGSVFPVVQWLVKFVYQTRFQRQRYDRELSVILGKTITQLQSKGNPDKLPKQPTQRTRINRTIQKTPYQHPIRVYSALLEYSDASSKRMYNKLLNIISNKNKIKQKNPLTKDQNQKLQQQNQSLINLLGDQGEQENVKDGGSGYEQMHEFGNFSQNSKLALDKLEQIIISNKEQIQVGIQENEGEEQGQLMEMAKYGKKEEKKQMGGMKEGKEDVSSSSSPSKYENAQITNSKKTIQGESSTTQQKQIKHLKNQNKKYLSKIQLLQNQLQSYQRIETQLDNQLQQLKQRSAQISSQLQKQQNKNTEFREMQTKIKQELDGNKSKVSKKIEKFVEKKQVLRNKKTEVKKKAKNRIDCLNDQLQVVLISVPEIDQQAFKTMLKEAALKKQIYDTKYQQLTIINQELAILQRKAESHTSAPEIAQYQQRFVELFEGINILIEEKRSMFSEMENLQSLKKVAKNYLQIMNNLKEGYTNVRKKSQLKSLNEDVREILQGLDGNMRNSEVTLSKMKGKRETVYGEYMDLIKLEREYLHELQLLKVEYENAMKYYK